MGTAPGLVKFPLPIPLIPYDVPPELRTLMDRQPVTLAEVPHSGTVWLVTGLAEVREVLTDRRYSRALAYSPGRELRGVDFVIQDSMLGMDPPEHSRLRRLVVGAFTERRLVARRPRVAKVVADLIDTMLAGRRPADLRREFAVPLPATIIFELLGVPTDDMDQFREWTAELFDWNRSEDELAAPYLAITGYMAELIARKRAEPADDLVTALIQARDSGDKLTEEELLKFCFGLLMAGLETTAAQICMSVVALSQHPDQLAWMRANPDRMPDAVEELLRYASFMTVVGMPLRRITTAEVRLGGTTIPAGEEVLPLMAAANRDPSVFPDPYRFDPARPPRGHVAFGTGAHHCLGARLARLELQEAFRGLTGRLPGLRLAVPLADIEFTEDQAVATMKALPVTWDDS